MSREKIAVIDFGTSKIVTFVTQPALWDNKRFDILGYGEAAYDGFQDTKWMVPRRMVQRVRASVAAAEKAIGESIKETYVGVPGGFLHVQTCTVSVTGKDGDYAQDLVDALMDKAAETLNLRGAASLVLHRNAAWYRVDGGMPTMEPDGPCTTLEGQISFITVMESFVEDVSEMLGVLGITIMGFVSSNYGVDMFALEEDERDEVAVVIDCGYLNTDITAVQGDSIIYHAVLPMGGGHITADLATDLQVRMREAERIKRDFVFNPDEIEKSADIMVYAEDIETPTLRLKREVVAQTIEKTVGDLCEMVRQTFVHDVDKLLTENSKVILTGGGIADMRGGVEYFAKQIGREVASYSAKTSTLNRPEYLSALGTMDIIMDSIAEPEQNDEKEKKLDFKKLFHRKNEE